MTYLSGQLKRSLTHVGDRRIHMIRILQLSALALALVFQALPSVNPAAQARLESRKAPIVARSANTAIALTAANFNAPVHLD